jgi:hypothetical protein
MENNSGSSSPFFASESSRSPSPPPTFEQLLWCNRYNSSGDAKALDLGKRMLLNKICIQHGIPEDVKMCIQDNI